MTRKEFEAAFGDLIVAARRADLDARERDLLVWSLEKEIRMILAPIDDTGEVWADLGFRRTVR